MIFLIISVLIFNWIAFKTNKRLNTNQIVHIWVFTIAFQVHFDAVVVSKYHGYWYMTEGVDFGALPAYTVLLPPINMMFLNWYPFNQSLFKKIAFLALWELFLLSYELLTMLPEPWGFFRYGWWKLWHSALIDPILLMILIGYYKWIIRIEKRTFRM